MKEFWDLEGARQRHSTFVIPGSLQACTLGRSDLLLLTVLRGTLPGAGGAVRAPGGRSETSHLFHSSPQADKTVRNTEIQLH